MAADPTTTAFANFQSPGLKDATYTVTAQIVIDPGVPNAPTFRAVQKTLQVGSDDPTLPPGSFVSVFPPENQSGDYGSHLPHADERHPTKLALSSKKASAWARARLRRVQTSCRCRGLAPVPASRYDALPRRKRSRLPKRAKKPLSVMSPVAAPHRGNGSSALDFEALTQRL
jgi:hypothetical protein